MNEEYEYFKVKVVDHLIVAVYGLAATGIGLDAVSKALNQDYENAAFHGSVAIILGLFTYIQRGTNKKRQEIFERVCELEEMLGVTDNAHNDGQEKLDSVMDNL
jgi:hypothetical protein